MKTNKKYCKAAEHPYLAKLYDKELRDEYDGDVWNKGADQFDGYCTRWIEAEYLDEDMKIAVPKIKREQNIQSSPLNNLSINSLVEYTSTNDCCLRCGSLDQTAAFTDNASAIYCESSESGSASNAFLKKSLNCETWKNLIPPLTSACLISNSCADSFDFERNSDLCSFISNFMYRGAKKSTLRDENKYEAAELGFINESKIFASKTNFILVYLPINFSLSFGDNSESSLLNAPLLIFFPTATDHSVNSFSSLDSSLLRSILNLIASEATFDQFSGSFSISFSNSSGKDIVIVLISNNKEIGYLKLSDSEIFFDKIASIKQLELQHVYDLAIEGTRNFIANDIVAHNTYLATSSGNVGIGTTSPTSTLHVIGTGNFSGNLYAGSCTNQTSPLNQTCTDIAELFAVEKGVKEGDVVCLKENGKAGYCEKEFDNKILGVISTAPAIIIEGDNIVLGRGEYSNKEKMPIALKGRVPVKVDCKVPIKQGDLLVSSNKKGYAMKLDLDSDISWKQATGTVLGKSLEECKNEEKIIMAWVG